MWYGQIQHENTDEYLVKRGEKPNDELHKNNAREMENNGTHATQRDKWGRCDQWTSEAVIVLAKTKLECHTNTKRTLARLLVREAPRFAQVHTGILSTHSRSIQSYNV